MKVNKLKPKNRCKRGSRGLKALKNRMTLSQQFARAEKLSKRAFKNNTGYRYRNWHMQNFSFYVMGGRR